MKKLIYLSVFALALGACSSGSEKSAEETVDEAPDKMEETVDEAGDAMEETVEEAGDAVEDAADTLVNE